MIRILLCLLYSLLLTTACQKEKDTPKPAPVVDGRWALKDVVDIKYDANGAIISQISSPAQSGQLYLDINGITVTNYVAGNASTQTGTYNAQGKTIIYQGGLTYDIIELTTHTLKLHGLKQPYGSQQARLYGGGIQLHTLTGLRPRSSEKHRIIYGL